MTAEIQPALAVLRVAAIVVGAGLAGAVLISALETVVLPRDGFTRIARVTFAVVNRILVRRWRSPTRSENLRGLYGPVALVSLPLVWMLSVIGSFTLIFWGMGAGTWQRSFEISGSSVTTLGFAAPSGSLRTWLAFVEAVIGLGLVALLISYLPTIYSAHHDRENGIRTLRPFAGTPASPMDLVVNLRRYEVIGRDTMWESATRWLLNLDQNHCAFPALSYFPESTRGQSWVASVGALLDAAGLLVCAAPVDLATGNLGDGQGPLMVLAHGVPGIVRIGRAAGLPIDPPGTLTDMLQRSAGETTGDMSITREEFDAAYGRLTEGAAGPVVGADEAWARFRTLRSSYDRALRGLAGLTAAAPAPWTTDRPAAVGRPRLLTARPVRVDWSLPAVPA